MSQRQRLAVGLVALGLVAFMPLVLLAPQAGARLFGLPTDDPVALAFLTAMGARDLAIGALLAVLLATRVPARVVGLALLAVAIVPVADALIVLRSGMPAGWAPLAGHVTTLPLIGAVALWLLRR